MYIYVYTYISVQQVYIQWYLQRKRETIYLPMYI